MHAAGANRSSSSRSRVYGTSLLALALAIGEPLAARAQQPSSSGAPSAPTSTSRPGLPQSSPPDRLLGDTVTRRATPAPRSGVTDGTLLDAPVNRAEYRLGPRDVVDIGIIGELNRVLSAQVGPEGTLLVPGMGVARVLGLTLDEAERVVRDIVLRYYHGVSVRLTLAEVRSFKVFVVGDVPNPGVRPASAATRVSEVVADATSGLDRRYRNVLLRRANGDSMIVDLVRFQQTGDLSANPTLREGDRLVMPAVDRTVQLYGRVTFPGQYEYRDNETLAQLLAIANGGGPFPSNAADTIRVTRFVSPEARELQLFSRAQATGPEGAAFVLRPFDAIYVPAIANFKEQRTATITGQVVHPGTYPIRPDTTTVRELVTLAGGFTSDASLVDATLRRTARTDVGPSARRLDSIPQEALSPEERRVLQARSGSDARLVVIDFQNLFAQNRNMLEQTLEDGDSLSVPQRTSGVAVLGAVVNPGIVPFAAGRSVDEYVRLAGGYARRADRRGRAVFKAKLGARYTANDARDVRTIDPGDQIVVPFRPRRDWLQTAYQIVTTITGIVVSIATVRAIAR
jgi:protein involved in polysaccharide export with SLBB domain